MIRIFAMIAIVSLLTSGCANLSPPSSVHALKPNTAYWSSYDSSRRGSTFVVSANGSIAGCSEPAPDVALSLSTGLKGSLKSGATEVRLASALVV